MVGGCRPFFQACDGLFTNYSWVPEDVTASAELAGERLTDLYIGIDVWGRNFHGGGQFNTQQVRTCNTIFIFSVVDKALNSTLCKR